MTGKKTRAIGYVRVSTAEQANKGQGLEIQEKAIRDWCRKQDHRLVAVTRDAGESGANGLDSREGLAEALARLERGEADVLVLYRYDRLARDLGLQETIIRQLAARGNKRRGASLGPVRVVSVTEPDASDDEPTRVMVRQILGAVGQYERAVIRGRMMAGKAQKKAKGGFVGGWAPYGYRVQDRELVADPDEQEAIGKMKRLRDKGRSLREIAGEIEAEGFEPRRGNGWHPTEIARILEREAN